MTVADEPSGRDILLMLGGGFLQLPQIRRDLMLFLSELAAEDPRPIWKEPSAQGRASGTDELFHFFFDDCDFEERMFGTCFFDTSGLAAVRSIMDALGAILEDIGDQGDSQFVHHPLWSSVRQAARDALSLFGGAI
ncbi:hypothetical protein [Blastomonas sp. UPD001]|uniref:SCO4402 family protein n=1 Tax=Blastomonas sp. UPD001 TaxID=2217673 RepID=UPI0013001BB6|nr:hypothetical protein [Blastomonas sp. UPD001]MBL0965974.1 hypothetical protein [Blastomonas sp.]